MDDASIEDMEIGPEDCVVDADMELCHGGD
jgi:hypothetical protein